MTLDTGIKSGDPAPDFALPDAGGRVHRLADFSGRWLALYFYPRDMTSGCTTEAMEFSALLPRFMAQGAAVVGISRDTPASHGNFIAKKDLTVLLLSDPDAAVHAAYGVWRIKKAYGREFMGAVRATFLIDPKCVVRQVWPKVARAAGHAEAVLAALGRLAGG